MPEREWIEAGLLDPAAPNAGERRDLLAWLESVGCSLDELVAAQRRGRLQSLAADRVLRPTPTLTREEVAEAVWLSPDEVDRTWLAAGFPPAPPGDVAYAHDDLALFRIVPAASGLFGLDTILAFTRVIGASLARIAEAADAIFITDVEVPRRAGGATEVDLARTGADAVTLLAGLPTVLEPLFCRHASAAVERSRLARAAAGFDALDGSDRRRVAVAFADLVGYTSLAERHDRIVLARAVGRFERSAAERAISAGARVVKSIGDAVMLVGPDPVALVDVTLGLAADVADDEVLTGLRSAVVLGDVLARDGDYVGPVVNLAARATKEAEPGGVVVSQAVADALAAGGRATTPLPPRPLRGFDDPVVLHVVVGG